MPKMTDDQRKQLEELNKLRADEEVELKAAEAEKEAAEKTRQQALAAGDKKGAAKADEIVTASESSVAALLEEMKRTQAMIVTLAEHKGGAEGKKAVEDVQRRRFLRNV